MTRLTTERPVSGSEHAATSFGSPFLVTCSMSTMT
ncbi:Uncharacterised protein [Mycobacteroides abscessus subsp. abscessus]|nr:Uncharacterised protein [Mycobacteroides abscessus subsp. abscessus]